MKIHKKIFSLCLLAFLSTQAAAMVVPKASKFDERIRTVQYNLNDVVQLDGKVGVSTHIQVEEGEDYVIHAFGDPDPWEFAAERNHYFIKPKEQHADTNLTIVTNLRSYHFRLNYHEDPKVQGMYGVHFDYPETRKKKAQLLMAQREVEQGFGKQSKPLNSRYTMGGDRDIAPTNVWDDGDFTYFKFPKERDLPGIYRVDVDGSESIVNRNTKGNSSNIIAVHAVNSRWVLRLGKRALGVYNETQWIDRTPNNARTVSPVIKRLVKE